LWGLGGRWRSGFLQEWRRPVAVKLAWQAKCHARMPEGLCIPEEVDLLEGLCILEEDHLLEGLCILEEDHLLEQWSILEEDHLLEQWSVPVEEDH
jgi:hypothetical protein